MTFQMVRIIVSLNLKIDENINNLTIENESHFLAKSFLGDNNERFCFNRISWKPKLW